MFEAEDTALHLERQLVGMAVRTPTTVVETIQPAGLVAVINLVACDPRDTELAA